MITACEINKIRGERLKYNLDAQGANRVSIMLKDARYLDNYFSFDKILLDAPCSGSGTINLNDKNLNNSFTEELISRSLKAQIALLNKADKILKTGGELVYSTCSILKEENELVLEKFLQNKNYEIVSIDNTITNNIPLLTIKPVETICIMPTELYEGFFVSKLRKKSK